MRLPFTLLLRPGLPRLRPLWLIAEAYRKFVRDDALAMAASIAYSALFSIFPLLIGVIAVVGLFVDQLEVRRAIVQTLSEYLPSETARFVDRNIAEVIRARGTFGIVAIVALFWSATALAAAIRHALNRVWVVTQPRPYLLRKLVELGLTLTAGALLILSLITSALLRAVGAFPRLLPAVSALQSGGGRLLSVLGPFVLTVITFVVIYRYLPNIRTPWRSVLIGAGVGGVLFEAANRGFFWYLQTFAGYQLVYGSLTGVIVFLLWVYLSAAILLFAAELAYQVGRPYPQEVGSD